MRENIDEKYKSIKAFKEKISKELKEIDPEDAEKYFYVENYFFNNKIPYVEERFEEILLEMTSTILKNYLQEFEYYTSLKPITPQTASDLEVISKKMDNLNRYYLQMHILYKKYHQIFLMNLKDKEKISEYVIEVYNKVKEVNEFSLGLQEKFIKNLKRKVEEIEKEDSSSQRYESPIYH